MNAQDRAALTQASRGGIAIFESMVAPPTLAAIKSKLDAAYEATPDHEQFFGCAKDIVHTLRDDAAFRELESEAVRAASNWLASTMHVDGKVGPWFGLRVGSSASTSGSHCRHFDSQVLTLVIVLQTASDDDRSGDLIVYPKARGIPRRRDNVLRKSMQWGERALPFPLRAARTQRHLDKGLCTHIRGTAGSIYVFNGFLMQHCNLDVLEGERRSLVIHYLDPGLSLGLAQVNRLRRNERAVPKEAAYPAEIDAT
ncbi:hypothetical protein QCE47_06535 [Caballeronia sp. LZ025]|jgi:hypothetical protein|uniref:hypothetical protein n=1 Tax=Caballeronia TaxID=1827195 RepID=UPI001FD18681|nr:MULTISPECIES: hypothetical protein [Caballeronia]MDR5732003.1 hypothetical protein [Caballeronia sp. LZ025]